jgi:hypothetical protein
MPASSLQNSFIFCDGMHLLVIVGLQIKYISGASQTSGVDLQ